MTATRVVRRLEDFQKRIAALRDARRILEEQFNVWSEALDDARLRSLMAETPQSDKDLAEARRFFEVAKRERDRRDVEIAQLVSERDRLLRDWSPKEVS